MNRSFWKGKRVFLTGHTGFKGSWLALTLSELGAKVTGFSNEVPTTPSLFELSKIGDILQKDVRGDIRNIDALRAAVSECDPEIVFHLAAQPLVRKSFKDPIETYSTNVMGTLNVLLGSLESKSLKSVVCVTTDKCYENKEWFWPYRENDHLGGHDPYSSSKACAEILSSSVRNSFYNSRDVHLATVRAGNVIGGGDWAEDRIIPDLVRAFATKEKLSIRNPSAVRPWQHVMEAVIAYIMLAEKLYNDLGFAEAWNIGPEDEDCLTVEKVISTLLKYWETHPGFVHVPDQKKLHEAKLLKLDSSKLKGRIGWKPKMNLNESLKMTSDWYKSYFEGKDMQEVTKSQIYSFLGLKGQ